MKIMNNISLFRIENGWYYFDVIVNLDNISSNH